MSDTTAEIPFEYLSSSMNLDQQSLKLLQLAAERLSQGFESLPQLQLREESESLAPILNVIAERLQDNFPYHHPFYLGQMMKPPHPLAQLVYALAMSLNPNNHALDGGRASSRMEQEVIQQLGSMIGWTNPLGHLCGGGTIANLEALWVAREFTSGKAIAVSQQAHYTHSRCAALIRVACYLVAHDEQGRMSISALEQLLATQDIGTVVVTLGTTGLGAVDPLEQILELQKSFGFRIHIDAAYGGYFQLAQNLTENATRQYALMHHADSIVIDPHKHGLQPYGCGCVLFRDHRAANVYRHDSPYTYFTSDQLHLGEISLECSRAGASAVALWATLQHFPLQREGAFAQRLESSRAAALMLHRWLVDSEWYTPVVTPELDIVVWSVHAESASVASFRARQIFASAASHDLHFALITLPRELLEGTSPIQNWDEPEVTCLRACLMKPEHHTWMPRILELLERLSRESFAL